MIKHLFKKISQNSLENISVRASFNKVAGLNLQFHLKRDSSTGIFLWILWNFKNIFFIEHLRWLHLASFQCLRNSVNASKESKLCFHHALWAFRLTWISPNSKILCQRPGCSSRRKALRKNYFLRLVIMDWRLIRIFMAWRVSLKLISKLSLIELNYQISSSAAGVMILFWLLNSDFNRQDIQSVYSIFYNSLKGTVMQII